MHLIPPNEAQMEVIKKEDFYQPPERIEEDVTELIKWLNIQPHLPNITDREWLTNFIVSSKYNLHKTKKIIEKYFIVRAEHPEFYGPITTEDITNMLKIGNGYIFPKLTSNGYRIICIKNYPTNDTTYDVINVIKFTFNLLDLQLKTEPIYGDIMLYDIEHATLPQLLAFTPTITKKCISCFYNSFPLRIISIHFINPPKIMSRALTFFNMFLPNKIKDRIMIHDNLEDLYEHIPKDLLPDIYGGTCGSIEDFDRDMLDFLCSNIEWLNRRKKADLLKLPNKEKSDEMDGTFKKLEID